jgi:hypothetical protein
MKTVELFCGTKSFSKVAREREWVTFTIDNDVRHNPDRLQNVLELGVDDVCLQDVDFFWASPPCTAFSVSSMMHHWTGGFRAYVPKTDMALLGLVLLAKTIKLISAVKPRKWYIENPRGLMRKVIDILFIKYDVGYYRRVTISYCQYGDTRMKPTDIWTNDVDWVPRPICKNGMPCHESAPRGARTGTQGMKNDVVRGVIPPAVFQEIFSADR